MKPFRFKIARHPQALPNDVEQARELSPKGKAQLETLVTKMHGLDLRFFNTETHRTRVTADALKADGHPAENFTEVTGIYVVPENEPQIWEMFRSVAHCNAPAKLKDHKDYFRFEAHCARAAQLVLEIVGDTDNCCFLAHGTITQGIVSVICRHFWNEDGAEQIEDLDIDEGDIIELIWDGEKLTWEHIPL